MKVLIQSVILSLLIVQVSCTKLEEEFRGEVTDRSSDINPQDLLQAAYNSLGTPYADQSRVWAQQEHTTDEALGPTRGPDWDDNGVWRVLHDHTWNADHGFLRDGYRELLQAQFAASQVILNENASSRQKAEATFIRALVMFSTLDGWDQVPYRASITDFKENPETKKGEDCANFLIQELEAAIANLPEAKDVAAHVANKDAARMLLMKLYLNKGVYKNRKTPTFDPADMDKVIALADAVKASTKAYVLQDNYFDNFGVTNLLAKELIFCLESSPGTRGFGVQHRYYMTLHYNNKPSGWNGFATLSDFYNKFEAADTRRGVSYPGVTDRTGLRVGFLRGQQFDQNGVELLDRKGNKLAFTDAVKLKETGNDLEITGIRVVKYPPDYEKEFPTRNQYVIFRYADALLMKAEALLRKGSNGPALDIVNEIRAKRGATALGSLSTDALLEERGRELYWEGWRRNDLVRFGKFLNPFQEKPNQSGDERLLFPIPNEQLAVNPNLIQNPGY
jgi:hypothetical protein